jgi:hypothetical protein
VKQEKASKAKTGKAGKPHNSTEAILPARDRPIVQTITIADVIEEKNGQGSKLRILADGFEHAITLEAPTASEQEAGQRLLRRLVDAAGILREIESGAELIGKTVEVTWFGNNPVFSRPQDEPQVTMSADLADMVSPNPPPPRPSKPKPKIQPREMPADNEGKIAMLDRWRKSGFFDDDEAA